MRTSKKIALTGMLCALAVVIMMMGGLIPLATFCCPAFAALVLIPIFVECGEKLSWAAYISIALLGLMLCPDKEAALLFLALGYYPIIRWRLEQIRSRAGRVFAKLGIFNAAVLLMYAACIFLFRMDQLMREYREMGLWLTIGCLAIGNVTLLIYDVLIANITRIYVNKFRNKLM